MRRLSAIISILTITMVTVSISCGFSQESRMPSSHISAISPDSLERQFFYYLDVDTDSAFDCLQELKFRAKKDKESSQYAIYQLFKGTYFHRINHYDSAAHYYHESVPVFKKNKMFVRLVAAYNNLGAMFVEKGDIDSSAYYLFSNLRLFDSLNDTSLELEKSKTLLNLGLLFQRQELYPEAEEYYRQSLTIKLLLNDKKGIALLYNNLAIINYFQNNVTAAENFFLSALKIYDEINDLRGLSRTLFNVGEIYFYEYNQLDKALYYYYKSYEIDFKLNDFTGQIESLSKMADVYFENKRYNDAEKLLTDALTISTRIRKHDSRQELLERLVGLYEMSGNVQRAYRFLKSNAELKDSLTNAQLEKQLLSARTEFEKRVEQLNKELVLNNLRSNDYRSKSVRITVLLGILLVFITVVLIIKINYSKQKNNVLYQKYNILVNINQFNSNIIYVLRNSKELPLILEKVKKLLELLKEANAQSRRREYLKLKSALEETMTMMVFPEFEKELSKLKKTVNPLDTDTIQAMIDIVNSAMQDSPGND